MGFAGKRFLLPPAPSPLPQFLLAPCHRTIGKMADVHFARGYAAKTYPNGNACYAGYFIIEPDEELFGDSEEQTFDQEILSRPSNSSQETESERLIRTGEMTPFGSIASSSSQTEVKAKPEKSGEDCVHMQESIEPKVCVNIYVCTT